MIGGRFIIIDDSGNPKAVLMDYKEFENLMVEKVAGDLARNLAEVQEINQEITRAQMDDLKIEVENEETNRIRVEPLPGLDSELD